MESEKTAKSPLDHYVSQVHLKRFCAPALDGKKLFAMRKSDLSRFKCSSKDVCRERGNSDNRYIVEERAIEEFLKFVEPHYNEAIDALRIGRPTPDVIFPIAGFAAYVRCCSPTGIRLQTAPMVDGLKASIRILESMGQLPPAPAELGSTSITELIESGRVCANVDRKYPQAIGIGGILEFIRIWGNSRWEIILNDDPRSPFFTSDFPIAFDTSSASSAIPFVVPLAPDLAIKIYPSPRRVDDPQMRFPGFAFRRGRASASAVREINRAIVRCAEDLVFFTTDQPWVTPFISKNADFKLETVTTRLEASDGTMLISSIRILPKVRDGAQARE